MKTCTKCGATKPVEEFYSKSSAKDGRAPWCRTCSRADNRARYRPDRARHYVNSDAYREKQRRERAAKPHVASARNLVAKALKRGQLTRPGSCERCSNTGRIEAHHEDYSRPLDVQWLCVRCHRAADADLRERKAA